ncbi:MAG: hypothetical protein C0594_04850 [Marinilabiliales bacterium]|nr:MAG: hypothetical protein C0594_04850 [Marinilabiliales bacterium]
MRKILQILVSSVLSLIILLSGSGLVIFHHHCSNTQENHYTILKKYKCHHHDLTCCNAHSCSINYNDNNLTELTDTPTCCSDDFKLVKTFQYNVMNKSNIKTPVSDLFVLEGQILNNDKPNEIVTCIYSTRAPPRIITGKDIIIHYQKIKIPDSFNG